MVQLSRRRKSDTASLSSFLRETFRVLSGILFTATGFVSFSLDASS